MQKCVLMLVCTMALISLKAEIPPLNLNVHIYNSNQNGLTAVVTPVIEPIRQTTHATRMRLGLGGLAISYLATLYFVKQGQRVLSDKQAWNNWYASLSLEELLAVPHKDLYEKLKQSIEIAYHSPRTTITVHATQFLNETAQELAQLRWFVRAGSFLRTLHLARLFFINPDTITRARDNIKRLIYMRTILADELSDQHLLEKLSIINGAQQ